MSGGYSSFDTLSIGLEGPDLDATPAPGAPLPVLARFPRVATAAPTAKPAEPMIRAVDASHETLVGPTYIDAVPDSPTSRPNFTPAPRETKQGAAYRVDPADHGATERKEGQADAPPPTTTPATVSAPVIDDYQEGWLASLLQLESAIAPYSQLIVLLTLLLAASLTLLLISGSPSSMETPPAETVSTPNAAQSAEADPQATLLAHPPETATTVAEQAPPTAATASGPVGIAMVRPIEPHVEPHRETPRSQETVGDGSRQPPESTVAAESQATPQQSLPAPYPTTSFESQTGPRARLSATLQSADDTTTR